MAIEIDEQILREAALTEQDFLKEIAVALFEKRIFTFAQARRFSGMDRLAFEQLISERKISIYLFDDYLQDADAVNKLAQ